MGYRYDIAIRSTHKYALRASGDVARIVDLPDGGVALLVIDGQGSGPAARAVARSVAARLTDLLESGSSADVAAIAANQALTSERLGQVSASFDIVRANPDGSIGLARFSTNSVLWFDGEAWSQPDVQSNPAGRSATNAPALHQCSANEAEIIVIATDGAGCVKPLLEKAMASATDSVSAGALATSVFESVLATANGRPKDDVTLAVLRRYEVPAEQRLETLDFSRDVR